jgi:hypothetical protein
MKSIPHKLRRTFAELLLALCIASPLSFAHAAQPDITPIDETGIDEFASEHCGFPVQFHLEATLIVNESGNSISVGGPWRLTWTNLQTGQTATGNNSIRIHQIETVDDGEIILDVVASGPSQLKASNGGVTWIEAGRFAFHIVIDAETFELISAEMVFEAGRTEDSELIDALCALLSN